MSRLTHVEKQQRVFAIAAGAYAVLAADEVLYCDATAGAVVPTLPLLTTSLLGLTWSFTKQDVSANLVVVTASGADLIDGAGSTALTTQYETLTVVAVRNAGGVLSWSVLSRNSTGGSGGTPAAGVFLGYSNRLWVM